jgi:hypothetical protein
MRSGKPIVHHGTGSKFPDFENEDFIPPSTMGHQTPEEQRPKPWDSTKSAVQMVVDLSMKTWRNLDGQLQVVT